MYNYKVVIADDESTIRCNLEKLLTEEFEDIQCIASCENGQQVLDILEKREVEIVISDIRMPLVSGLEIAKYIKENNLKTKLILISGFSEFEYAHKAIKYGVDDFITKPIDFDDLVKSVREIKNSLEEQLNKTIDDTIASLSKREMIKKYISLYMMGVVPYGKISELANTNRDIFAYKSCAVADITIERIKDSKVSKANNIWADICEISNEKINCFCISESSQNVRLLFFNYESNEDKRKQSVEEHLEECKKLMWAAYGIKFTYTVEYMNELKNSIFFDWKELSNMYIGYMLRFNTAGISEFLRILYATMSIENIRKFFESVLNELQEKYLLAADKFKGKIAGLSELNGMLQFSKELNEEFRMISNMDYAVNKVILYINENFDNKDLNFNYIADKLQFNRSYLSREFKRRIGQNPSEYIFNIRIEKAKKLLKTNEYTLEEVAEKVGYSDKGYFGQVFKKTTGVTPFKYARTGEE